MVICSPALQQNIVVTGMCEGCHPSVLEERTQHGKQRPDAMYSKELYTHTHMNCPTSSI